MIGKYLRVGLAAAALCSFAACGSEDKDLPGMANPASVFCEQQGGTVEIVDEGGGQVGYCNLPDGTRIEEWEYYYANHPTETTG